MSTTSLKHGIVVVVSCVASSSLSPRNGASPSYEEWCGRNKLCKKLLNSGVPKLSREQSQVVKHISELCGRWEYRFTICTRPEKTLRKKIIMKVKMILEENLKPMMSNATFNSCWKVVDLGCSCGPNALMVISNIVNIIDKISLSLSHESPTFQIYLNDLFENDFNTIVKSVPDFNQRIQQERGDNVGACFINATPGNFYGRLFPSNYINFFHSSWCVHWLSQAPKYSTSKKAEPLNKGNIHITRTSPPLVYNAYFKQFQRDFKYFLKSRFEELASSGMMVLTLIGRDTTCEIASSYEVLGMVLNEMVQEGLVEEEKLDLFNLPLYHPTIKEVRQLIEEEGSFTLHTLKTFKIGWDADLQEDIVDYVLDSKMRGEFIANWHRAVFEPLLSAEFGENIIDELFSRFTKLIAQLVELKTPEFTNIVLFMTKYP